MSQLYKGERLAKVIARAGLCSRRDAENWILNGRVFVNGKSIKTPAFNVEAQDLILVDGEPLPKEEPTELWLYHKPVGLITSHKDPNGRPTVFESLKERYPTLKRLISVGRLDYMSEGLLLLTNDGELARFLELPQTGWLRNYRVRVFGRVEEKSLKQLEEGITIQGVHYGKIEASIDRVQTSNTWLYMSLREGKNREIRRVMEHLGYQVNRLIRFAYGPFELGALEREEIKKVPASFLKKHLSDFFKK